MGYEALILLIIFQYKHLLADYYWQFPYMYQNKGQPTGWIKPLAYHAGMHASLTGIIAGIYLLASGGFTLIWLLPIVIVLDFVTHFATDRWKAVKKDGPDTPQFWHSLGIDQMVHHIVGIIIVFIIV